MQVYMYIIGVLGECLTLLASGSDQTCHVGCVAFIYIAMDKMLFILDNCVYMYI